MPCTNVTQNRIETITEYMDRFKKNGSLSLSDTPDPLQGCKVDQKNRRHVINFIQIKCCNPPYSSPFEDSLFPPNISHLFQNLIGNQY